MVIQSSFDIVRGMKTDIQKKEHSEVEIKVTLPAKELEKYREAVMKKAFENLEVDGFRKGNVPEEIAKIEIIKTCCNTLHFTVAL